MLRIKGKNAKVEGDCVETQPQTRKPYAKPKILHELKLETRAGSPLSIHDQLDPWGLEPPKE
ncbi:MAG TPA: hypothetical protein EYP55_04175 [Anaerolineae bacterium]|nr:hypothetical protein [Anaerolineae bacterium]